MYVTQSWECFLYDDMGLIHCTHVLVKFINLAGNKQEFNTTGPEKTLATKQVRRVRNNAWAISCENPSSLAPAQSYTTVCKGCEWAAE